MAIDPSREVLEELVAGYASQEGRVYSMATPDTLSLPLQAILARVRKREADRSALPAPKRRISVKTSPSATGSSHNSLLRTSEGDQVAD